MSRSPIELTDIALMCKALGDPTRLRIFQFLRECCCPVAVDDAGRVRRVEGPTAGEVCCEVTGIDRVTSTVSFHLKELRLAGLVTVTRRGRHVVCGVNQASVERLADFLGASRHTAVPEGSTAMEDITLTDREDVRALVRERYGAAALTVLEGRGASCCSSGGASASCCSSDAGPDPITAGIYSSTEASEIPEAALLASLGCGNPTALAALNPGEVVLDLGSGGGIDVLLSARRVGPTGFAYGLDMTDEMLAVAEQNRAEAGAENARFLKGHIEDIPLPDASVDVVISNCVINLSADKDAVLREAFRVLKPGGRFAVSDIVWRREVPANIRKSTELWAGCIAGALLESDYRAKLEAAGFTSITVTPTREFTAEDAATIAGADACSCTTQDALAQSADAVVSAFIRAEKPQG